MYLCQDFEQAVLSLKHSGALTMNAANEIVLVICCLAMYLCQDFEQAVLSLKHSGALTMNAANEIVVQKSLNKHTTFYSQMFEPFLLAYWVSFTQCLHCRLHLIMHRTIGLYWTPFVR